jgi:hypothetical protein
MSRSPDRQREEQQYIPDQYPHSLIKDWLAQFAVDYSQIQPRLPQVSEQFIDQQGLSVLGRVTGPLRHYQDVSMKTAEGTIKFRRPEETQFVLFWSPNDQGLLLRRYNPDIMDPWEDIPDTHLTPQLLFEQTEGFGVSLVTEGELVRKARKQPGGASRTHWEPRHNPKPKRIKK